MYDFANILFSGRCNARCPFCIGKQVSPHLNRDNLDEFPPRGIEHLVQMVQQYRVRNIVFTGTNTDPLLYRYTTRLLIYLRSRLASEVKFSLHTNGRLALPKMAIINQFDRLCLSLPSFNPETYWRMMGVPGVPNVADVLRRALLPVKLSCMVMDENVPEIGSYLKNCQNLGIRRVVLRKRFGEKRSWDELLSPSILPHTPSRFYRGNPVYDLENLEVTLWDFEQAECSSINLFSVGIISTRYLLTDSSTEQHPAEQPMLPL